MSRLGDLIHLERTRQGLNFKQVARKCGVSEKFLQEVESGKRIIADDQARRILKAIGMKEHTEADFTLDDIAATVDLQSAVPRLQAVARAEKKPEPAAGTPAGDDPVNGSIWLDALSSVIKRVPVYNAAMKVVDHRLLPITDGRIAGAPPDKVYYYLTPDDMLQGFRIRKGDLLLVVPCQAPVDGAVMVLKTPVGHVLRKIKVLPHFQAALQTYDTDFESEIRAFNDLIIVGRCVRLEAELT